MIDLKKIQIIPESNCNLGFLHEPKELDLIFQEELLLYEQDSKIMLIPT